MRLFSPRTIAKLSARKLFDNLQSHYSLAKQIERHHRHENKGTKKHRGRQAGWALWVQLHRRLKDSLYNEWGLFRGVMEKPITFTAALTHRYQLPVP